MAKPAVKEKVTLTPMEHLVNRTAKFYSKHAGMRTYPCGPPVKQIVGNPGGFQQIVPISRPQVKFQNHFYETRDAAIAQGLVDDETNFEKNWGWKISTECLPSVLRSVYNNLCRDGKRAVINKLIEGHDADKTFDMIPEDVLARAKEGKEGGGTRLRLDCPAGCGKIISIEGTNVSTKDVQMAMQQHVNMMHPGFNPAEATQTGEQAQKR